MRLGALTGLLNDIIRGPLVRTFASREQRLLRQLQALTPPPEAAAVYTAFVLNAETVLSRLKQGDPKAALGARIRRAALARLLHAPACRLL